MRWDSYQSSQTFLDDKEYIVKFLPCILVPAGIPKALGKFLEGLENTMLEHARNLEFEEAAALRDQIRQIKEQRLMA